MTTSAILRLNSEFNDSANQKKVTNPILVSTTLGELELEATLDRQLYHHGDTIAINICVRNNSNKVWSKW